MTTRRLERISTGSPELDLILGGGLPTRSVVMITGAPGSGKTVLTLQLLFRAAGQGSKCLFFTTLSEPALKLLQHMQCFSFFDASQLDRSVRFVDIGSRIRAEGAGAALAEVARRVEEEEPALVVIDSFKAIHDLLPDRERARVFAYDLAVQLSAWGATTLLVGEYEDTDIVQLPEFAVADAILRLGHRSPELTSIREIEVLKLRGSRYESGRHFFEIADDGVRVYPRVRAPETDRMGFSLAERVATGVPELDPLLDGGFPRGSATLVEGATGAGKTLFGLSYLVHGARTGEPGVLFTLEETPDQIRAIGESFGWEITDLERRGLLHLHYTSPVELSTDRFLHEARSRCRATGARRTVLDSLTGASLGVPSERRFRELVHAATKHFRAMGITPVMTMEVPEMLGTSSLTGHFVSSAADNLILLRYVEVEGHLERAISVLKARGVKHRTDLRRYVIGDSGPRVEGSFGNLRGVLTGIPVPARHVREEGP